MFKDSGKIQYKYQRLEQAAQTLIYAYEDYNDFDNIVDADDEKYERRFLTYRDSLITRFNYTFDSLWKYVRLYMELYHDVTVQGGPRDVFRASLEVLLLSPDDVEICLEMLDSRNEASHIYKEEIANLIATKMAKYIVVIKKILETMRPS
ncbi:HI0074 family nucleotidyltransferase substrate-binding subunit [Candidatus Babeliales bacterium]|nr:HI0074 family nucleotidyltransferase substrate-binding subunit [Candidatus Babeliales bacterium]